MMYVIQRGDSLWKIARKFGVGVESILAANPGLDPNSLQVGRKITIPAKQPTTIWYRVKPGDSLWSISRKFGVSVQQIADLNGITNPDSLEPGTWLKIPMAPTTPAPTGGPGQVTYYTVQPGDTLSSIAESFNTTVAVLTDLNQLADPNVIYPGQVLLVPSITTTLPPTVVPITPTPLPTTTTLPPTTTILPTTTLPPTTTILPTTTLPPTTTILPTTTLPPTTTILPTTTLPPTTTILPTTTLPPTTTFPPTTTLPPTTTFPPTTTILPTICPTMPPIQEFVIYQVQPGDTLVQIAVRFNSTVNAIVANNGIVDPNVIYPGEIFFIPANIAY